MQWRICILVRCEGWDTGWRTSRRYCCVALGWVAHRVSCRWVCHGRWRVITRHGRSDIARCRGWSWRCRGWRSGWLGRCLVGLGRWRGVRSRFRTRLGLWWFFPGWMRWSTWFRLWCGCWFWCWSRSGWRGHCCVLGRTLWLRIQIENLMTDFFQIYDF